MPSADIFAVVENFLSAATAFFYSLVQSLYLLARHPTSAPRFLTRRYKNPSTKQVGPLTIHFLILASISLIFAMIFDNSSPDKIKDLVFSTEKSSTVAFILACMVGTTVIDATSRLAVRLGWPRHLNTPAYVSRRENPATRRIAASYALILPTITIGLGLFCSVFWFFLALFDVGPIGKLAKILPAPLQSLYIFAVPCIFMLITFGSHRSNFYHWFFRARKRSPVEKSAIYLGGITAYFSIFAAVYAASTGSTTIVEWINIDRQERTRLAANNELDVLRSSCILMRNNTVRIYTEIFNPTKSTALFTVPEKIRIFLPDQAPGPGWKLLRELKTEGSLKTAPRIALEQNAFLSLEATSLTSIERPAGRIKCDWYLGLGSNPGWKTSLLDREDDPEPASPPAP